MRVCIMDAIVAAGLLEKITENMLLSENGQCYLWTAGMKGKNNRYGVIRCEFWGRKRSIDVHRVMYCIANEVTLEDIAGMDASHLCHNSLCVTASHIVVEPHGINNNRIGCKSRLDGCSGHTPFPDCLVSLALLIEK